MITLKHMASRLGLSASTVGRSLRDPKAAPRRRSTHPLARLRRALHRGDAALEALCVVLLSLTVLLTLLQVFYRYALNDALTWSEELARLLFVWAVWLGIAVVTGRRRHMRSTSWPTTFRPRRWRGVDLVGRAIAAAACVALLVHGGDFALRVTSYTAALQMPSAWMYAAVPVGAALNLVYLACQRPTPALAALARRRAVAGGPRPLQAVPQRDAPAAARLGRRLDPAHRGDRPHVPRRADRLRADHRRLRGLRQPGRAHAAADLADARGVGELVPPSLHPVLHPGGSA